MRSANTLAFSTSSDATTSELLELITASLVRLLTAGGLAADEITASMNKALRNQETPTRTFQLLNLGQAQRDCMEVLCLWRRDPEFLTLDGVPAPLTAHGEASEFQALCKKAGVATDSAELLATLSRFGAIQLTGNECAVPKTPTFLLSSGPGSSPIAFDGVLKQIAGFIRVIEYNLFQTDANRQQRFERACTVVVAQELLPVFEKLVASRGQDFVDVIDEWLERHSVTDSPSNRYIEIGAGAYFVDFGEVIKNK